MKKFISLLVLLLFAFLLTGCVGGVVLTTNMRDVQRSEYIEQFIIRSKDIGDSIEDAQEFLKSPIDKVEKEVNDFFTSKIKYIEGGPLEIYEWESLNGFEKAWYYVKSIDWWPFW